MIGKVLVVIPTCDIYAHRCFKIYNRCFLAVYSSVHDVSLLSGRRLCRASSGYNWNHRTFGALLRFSLLDLWNVL